MIPADLPPCLKALPVQELQGIGLLIRILGRDKAIEGLKNKRPVREATQLVETYLQYFDEPVAVAPV